MSEPTKRTRGLFAALAAGSLITAGLLAATPATAAPPATPTAEKIAKNVKGKFSDNLSSPRAKQQNQQRQAALEKRLKGDKAAQQKVVKVGKGQYVKLANEGTDKIFVVLVDFGDNQYPNPIFQGPPPDGSATDVTGPQNNEIPEPDRSVDNSTLWQPDYNQAHYQDMYFNRMKKYYETQSSGRYSVDGTVTEWVKVPFNEALYGRDYCGSIVCNTSKALVRDALAMWVKSKLDSGMTMPQITAYLKTFDQQDRYDINGNGNFDEPDGVIDHFQIVHAGGDEAAGDPNQGTDAIWSHRSAANLQSGGPFGVGVDVGSNGGLVSSSLVPNNPTGVWVYDYTMQPENGGLGVFAHEFGHDLGLPDLYDTSGNTGGAENSTAFWTLMSSGANIGDGRPDGIGDAPTDLGAWEKFQLGWLGCPTCPGGSFYETVHSGDKKKTVQLGPNDAATKKAQALFVVLPDKNKKTFVVAPKTGGFAYWSGMGDNFSHTMTKPVTYAAGSTLTADFWFDTEPHYDYVFLEVSHDNGTTWEPVLTNLSEPATADEGSFNGSGTGIAGSSGGVYETLTASLPGSGPALVRWRYETDANTGGKGAVVDNMAITGNPVDGAESDADRAAWTYNGFTTLDAGNATTQHFNAYLAENRQYDGYDASLRTAYNFGFLNTKPDWVENYPYQNGMLVTYWDESFSNNNVGEHPGGGLALPVDAHPSFEHWASDGQYMRQRIQSYDSTFGLERTDAITVHKDSVATTIASKPAVPTFDDTKTWWYATDGHTAAHEGRYQVGWTSVDVPKTGTAIKVLGQASGGKYMTISVGPSK